MSRFNRGQEAEIRDSTETKTPFIVDGYEAETNETFSTRRIVIPRRTLALVLGLALSIGVIGRKQDTAEAYQTPVQDTPTGFMLRTIVDRRAVESGNPTLEQDILSGFNSFSDLGENILATAKPQAIKKVTFVRDTNKQATVSIQNVDSESAFLTPSPNSIPDGSGHPMNIPYVDQIDNDVLLHNTRYARLFKVNRLSDWQKRARWQPVSNKVAIPEWTETDINAPLPSDEYLSPNSSFVSPLTQWSSAEMRFTKPVSTKGLKLGLVALEITRAWQQRNEADGSRRGFVRFIYPLTSRKSTTIDAKTLNYIYYKSRDAVHFKYSDTPPQIDSAQTISKKIKAKTKTKKSR